MPLKNKSNYLSDGVTIKEIWSWAMFDFANSGYTTVVITAIFNAYFVSVVAGNADWGTFAWTASLSVSYLLIILTAPMVGAYADAYAKKKQLLFITAAGCIIFTALLSLAGPGDLWLGISLIVLSNFFFGSGGKHHCCVPAGIGQKQVFGENIRLGLVPRLSGRLIQPGLRLGLCHLGAGARPAFRAVCAGHHAHHRRDFCCRLYAHLPFPARTGATAAPPC